MRPKWPMAYTDINSEDRLVRDLLLGRLMSGELAA